MPVRLRPHRLMKTCGACDVEKPLDEFHRRGSKRQAWCKACRKTYDRQYHHGYLERRKQVDGVRREALRDWVWRLKSEPCMDCGGRFHPVSMQFDHRPGEKKSHNIGNMVARRTTRARIEAEIAKCDLVCANCHAVRTWERYGKTRPAEQGFEADCNSA